MCRHGKISVAAQACLVARAKCLCLPRQQTRHCIWSAAAQSEPVLASGLHLRYAVLGWAGLWPVSCDTLWYAALRCAVLCCAVLCCAGLQLWYTVLATAGLIGGSLHCLKQAVCSAAANDTLQLGASSHVRFWAGLWRAALSDCCLVKQACLATACVVSCKPWFLLQQMTAHGFCLSLLVAFGLSMSYSCAGPCTLRAGSFSAAAKRQAVSG